MKKLTVYLSDENHDALKRAAEQLGVSLKEYVEGVLNDFQPYADPDEDGGDA